MTEELQLLKTKGELANWRSKVLGGGRIKHDPDGKKIQVYGYSQVSEIFFVIFPVFGAFFDNLSFFSLAAFCESVNSLVVRL